jgi:endonuclease YncB( thermonuclease family)
MFEKYNCCKLYKYFFPYYKMDIVEDAPNFSLDGYKTNGRIASVYDGDTVRIIFSFHGTFYKWNCRLAGIDTPELRTSNDKEKEYGYQVRDILREKILNKVVSVECGKFDKYGRLLVTITCDEDCCVNKWLVENKYALEYDGGKKQDWADIL